MPIIILEGVDCAGKTTLAEAILELPQTRYLNARVWHKGPPVLDSIRDEYERPFFNPLINADDLIICDRWHVGETIYGPMFREHSALNEYQRHHLEMTLTAIGAVLVYVHVGEHSLVTRLRTRGDDMVDINQALRINELYRTDAPRAWMPHLNINGNAADFKRNAKNILIRAEAATSMAVCTTGAYIGSNSPDILLVGDQRGDSLKQSALRAPFPPYSAQGCSSWFWEVLTLGFRHTPFGLTNAYGDNVDVEKLWVALGRPRVVALGRASSDHLNRHRIRHGVASHPQWWKRFRHDDRSQYAQHIRDAATQQKDLI